ncbi:hypothetical protein MA20_47910, partial [Bradyrhizobium japonicum]
MAHIQFHSDTFQLAHAGETISLLPKEYALFHFLYNHPNQSFSREELLNRVWPLEEPTDRTVDDHIYRLRKKLIGWSHLFTLESIRGYGYKLVEKGSPAAKTPLALPEVVQNVQRLIETYHGLGMGDAMQTLSSNREVLGIQLDSFYSVYMHFLSGDFQWIVETETLSFWEKASYLILFYSFIQEDQTKTIDFCERTLQKKQQLPRLWGVDLEINMISLYVEAGQLERAKERLQAVEKEVVEMNSPSFTLIFLFKKIIVALALNEREDADKWLNESERLLGQFPLKRELGFYTIIRGLHLYQSGMGEKGRQAVDEGIDI